MRGSAQALTILPQQNFLNTQDPNQMMYTQDYRASMTFPYRNKLWEVRNDDVRSEQMGPTRSWHGTGMRPADMVRAVSNPSELTARRRYQHIPKDEVVLPEIDLEMHTAKLDWITPDAEKVIARHARVSTSNPDREEYVLTLSYCIKHGHWSILEQANVSFEIITSRAISAQRSVIKVCASRNCPSGTRILLKRCQTAFTIDLKSFQFESKLIRIVSQTLKTLIQGCCSFRDRIYKFDAEAYALYSDMLEAGVARECARNILPMYTPTRLHANGTVRSWAHYVGLRAKEDTQLEHQLIARQIAMILGLELPTVVKALVETKDPRWMVGDFCQTYPDLLLPSSQWWFLAQ